MGTALPRCPWCKGYVLLMEQKTVTLAERRGALMVEVFVHECGGGKDRQGDLRWWYSGCSSVGPQAERR